jgi:hypothetical protein
MPDPVEWLNSTPLAGLERPQPTFADLGGNPERTFRVERIAFVVPFRLLRASTYETKGNFVRESSQSAMSMKSQQGKHLW